VMMIMMMIMWMHLEGKNDWFESYGINIDKWPSVNDRHHHLYLYADDDNGDDIHNVSRWRWVVVVVVVVVVS
jgi:hypothetical protein